MTINEWKNHLRTFIATGSFQHITGADKDVLEDHRNFMLGSTEEALYDLAGVCINCGNPREACACSVTFDKALMAMRAGKKVCLRRNPKLVLYLESGTWFPQPVICVFSANRMALTPPQVWPPHPWDLTSTEWVIL